MMSTAFSSNRLTRKNSLRSLLYAACLLFAESPLRAQQPDNLVFTGTNGSLWNDSDPRWNGNQTWSDHNGAEFSGGFHGMTIELGQNISATYVHFKGLDQTPPAHEYTIRGDGHTLHAYQIIFTNAGHNATAGAPVPAATFRNIDLVVGGGGIGTGVYSDSDYASYDYRSQVMSGSRAAAGGVMHFREASRLTAAVGIHTEMRDNGFQNTSLDPDISFHDTSVFQSLGAQGGTLRFFNQSSMVLPFDRFVVEGGQRFFHHESVLDIQARPQHESAIVSGQFTFSDSSVMNASSEHSVGWRHPYDSPEHNYNAPALSFTFHHGSRLNLLTAGAIIGGDFIFHEGSTFNHSVSSYHGQGVSGTFARFAFHDYSVMELAEGLVEYGSYNFYDSSVLNIREGTYTADTARFHFHDQSELNAYAEDALRRSLTSPDRQTYQFSGGSTLNAGVARAINDVNLSFSGSSTLNARVRHAIVAPTTNHSTAFVFGGSSTLNALATESVFGGKLEFHDHSTLNADAMFALQETTLEFHDDAILHARATAAVNTGTHSFSDRSSLQVSASQAVAGTALTFSGQSTLYLDADLALSGSEAVFYGTSSLNANVSGALRDSDNSFKFRDGSALNLDASHALSRGTFDFRGTSSLNVEETRAVQGGTHVFAGSSSLNVNAHQGLAGGTLDFAGSSTLNLNAADALSGGSQTFHDSSSLNANYTWAVQQGTQNFYDSSAFYANYGNSIEGGTQFFHDQSSLHLVEKAVAAGTQNFYHDSVLHATRRQSIFGGEQNFHDNSVLLATDAEAVDGGFQIFSGSSSLNAYHSDALSGGTQIFNQYSSLNARAHSTRSANDLAFYGYSRLNAQTSQAVINGNQTFHDSSTLNIEAGYGVMGGAQTFLKTSTLNANASHAITGGTQVFEEAATFNINASNALAGGTQTFQDNVIVNVNASHGIAPGLDHLFQHQNILNANVTASITGGTQTFRDHSILNANAVDAIDGGVQSFHDDSSLNITASYGVLSGAHILLSDASTLNASAAHAIYGAAQIDYQRVYNTLHGTIPDAGTAAISYELEVNSQLNLLSSQAMSGGLVVARGDVEINASVSQAISGGFLYMTGSTSTLNLTTSNALSGGTLVAGVVNASGTNAITGGHQMFGSWGTLNASARDAVNGGVQEFYGGGVLNASAGRAIRSGQQSFESGSVLNATQQFAIAGGSQTFYDSTSLNAASRDAVSAGIQTFHDSSRLNITSDWGVVGGSQTFHDSSSLLASEIFAIEGGTQTFYDNSSFQANANQVIRKGIQNFHDDSQLNVGLSASEIITGGTQNFYDDSIFNAGSRSITAGAQNFYDDSKLIANRSDMITGGVQNFYGNSILEAIGQPALRAISSGTQTFHDTSQLVAARANAVTGGTQNFRDKSVLHASETGALINVTVRLNHEARLDVNTTNALSSSVSVNFNETSPTGPGGIFRLNGHNVTVGALRSQTVGSGRIENNAETDATLTVSFNAPSELFGGEIRDGSADSAALALVKAGTGAWTLSGSNSWTGGTDIQVGRIIAAHDSALGHGDISVRSGAVLATSGKRQLANDIVNHGLIAGDVSGEFLTLSGHLSGPGGFSGSIELAGSFSPGSSPALISASGDLSLAQSHTLLMEIGGLTRGTEYDAFDVSGHLRLGGHLQVAFLDSYMPLISETYTLFSAGGLSGSFSSYDFSRATPANPKLAWDVSELNQTGKLLLAANPFYGQENPEGTLHIVRTGEGSWAADSGSDYTGEVVIEDATVRVGHDQALGTGEVSIAENGRIEGEGSRTLANDVVNQGVIAGPDSEGDDWMRLEGDVSGAGSYEGNIEFAGSFSPGNSPALISADGNLTFDAMNTLVMEIGGLTRGTGYDAFDVNGTLTLGGAFVLVLLDDFVPLVGQSFHLFDAGNLAGAFSSLDFTLASVGDGLYWNTSLLGSDGIVSVDAVPEPSTIFLIALALVGLFLLRRHRTARN